VATLVHPPVSTVVVNDGAAQRSLVTSLTVTFNTVVTLDPRRLRVGPPGGRGDQSADCRSHRGR
jgi:hypothetical protein